MPSVELVSKDGRPVHGFALLDRHDAVWITFYRPWWALADWFWYWLAPGPKKWLLATRDDGERVRIRAFRLAEKYIRMGQ